MMVSERQYSSLVLALHNNALHALSVLFHPRSSHTMKYSWSYDEIIYALTLHFLPKPLFNAKCFYFYRYDQQTGEPAAMYMTELHGLSKQCRFDAYPDQELRDRLVLDYGIKALSEVSCGKHILL